MYTANSLGVPVVLVSGDNAACGQCREISPNTATVATKIGHGDSVICRHPARVRRLIQSETEAILKKEFSKYVQKLPDEFAAEIEFKDHGKACRASFYPGIQKTNPTTLVYKAEEIFEILRMLHFVISV
jgi:D-amino peptidase